MLNEIIFYPRGEMFPLLGDVASAERGGQTGFPNPLLGWVEPLVNSPGSGGRTPAE